MITIKTFYFNPLRECTYVALDRTKECVIIDPGCNGAREFDRMKEFIAKEGLKPVKILLTHCHFDHILGVEDTSTEWSLEIYASDKDRLQKEQASRYCPMMGMEYKPITKTLINLEDGDEISFGESSLKVIATPGHTEGGLCFFDAESKVLFSGDTLFAGSVGRTDLEGGDYDKLHDSITRVLAALPPDTEVFPGHGPTTNLGYEISTNPFIRL